MTMANAKHTWSRCATRLAGEQCRLEDDHQYRGLSCRFVGETEKPEDESWSWAERARTEMAKSCPTCGHDVKVVGDTTQHYQPIGCGQPPSEDAATLRNALGLMRSMILSGEKMSPIAEKVIDAAIGVTKGWGPLTASPLEVELSRRTEQVERIRSYCQDTLAIFLQEGIDSPPAVGVADVLKMLGED